MKAMTPGQQHAELATMAGTWDVLREELDDAPTRRPRASSGTEERNIEHGRADPRLER